MEVTSCGDVDWLILVPIHEHLEHETAQLMVHTTMPLHRLEPSGITCTFITAKYIERFPPRVGTLCALAPGT